MADREDSGRRGKLGSLGEDIVCRFLTDRGHTVLERNWRCGHLEIDIISAAADGIHFVEVKTRSRQTACNIGESVGRAKQRRLAAAAGGYLNRKCLGVTECFFDVASVICGSDGVEIEYIPEAFVPVAF